MSIQKDANFIQRHTERAVVRQGQVKALMEVLADIPDPRAKKIIYLHFGFYNGKRYTQKEIAEMMQLHPVTISNIVNTTIQKLRATLLEQGAIEQEDIKSGKGLR